MLIALEMLLMLPITNAVDTPQGDQEPTLDEVDEQVDTETPEVSAGPSDDEAETSDADEAPPELNEVSDEQAEVTEQASFTADETPQLTETDAETSETSAVQPTLGVIEHVHDFVASFDSAQSSNASRVSASAADSSGGVRKPAIFQHPRAEGDARIEYAIDLPKVNADEHLMLHFWIGLRDGIDFDTPSTKPNGVRFALEVDGERRFEGVSVACQWAEHGIDITDLAARKVTVAFLTNCNGDNNTNYDWALWGNPEILKLTRLRETGEDAVEMQRGLAIALLECEPPQVCVTTFDLEAPMRPHEITGRVISELKATQDARVSELALYAEQPELAIVGLGSVRALVAAREDFELQCTIRNTGRVALQPTHDATLSISRIKLRRGRATQTLKTLAPGATATLTWNIRSFARESKTQVAVSLKHRTLTGVVRQNAEQEIAILADAPKLSNQAVSELNTYEQNGHVVAENANLRVVFVKGNRGYTYALLFATRSGRYRHVATCPALSEIRYRDASGQALRIAVEPPVYQLGGNSKGESIVILSGQETDADGVTWKFESRFTLTETAKRLRVSYRLETTRDRELLAFNGPMVYAGDGTFGESKTAALFPGLEFLEGDEASSSTRDAAPPLNNRLVPHPYKITIPLMAVEYKKTLVGLMWDNLQTWDGEHNMVSAVFASPNWHQHQNNHLMELFLPSCDWVKDGAEASATGLARRSAEALEATTPYPLKGGNPITLDAHLIIDGEATILDALEHWYGVFGTPKPLDAPRNDEEELMLSRHALMQTVWDEQTRKSRHCVGWKPDNAPGFATLLWYDYLVQTQDENVKDEGVKRRVMEIVENTVRESGKRGLVSTSLCHILKWELPFYVGHLETGLEQVETVIKGIIDSQGKDGGWRFHPNDDRTRSLGREGDAVLGTCAHAALTLLKYARVTGDTDALAAGLKALKFTERFGIPRGAQAWECPLYEPDILAAAHIVGAYAEAYHITEDKAHLEMAEYWAKTGLPFLYHWHLPDRPGMQFASIPVFGTTFYTHSWFGVPVQWNGLVYAYHLQHLARYSPPERQTFWSRIAEGVLVSAMYQQWTEGELKGTYPDGFYGFCTEGKGPHINPEDIMVNLYALRGLDPDISTRVLQSSKDRIHVSSGGKVEALAQRGSGLLNFTLRYVQFETSYTLITGFAGKPSAIRSRDGEIPFVDDLETVSSGWLYRPESNRIFIKYKHPIGEMRFEVLPPVAETEGAGERGSEGAGGQKE